MTDAQDKELAAQIRQTEKSSDTVKGKLETDELVLARITEGIYRQPASALRELISNAYDADATEIVILTDAPRFSQIVIRDNGIGLTPEVLTHLVKHIGGSAKRTGGGIAMGIASSDNANRSKGGRYLIGKLGIGLFSVAQFTRHFLIITKTEGDTHRTIADITLGKKIIPPSPGSNAEDKKYETGEFSIWREKAADEDSHGTEIQLIDLLPRTRAELASEDLWNKIDEEAAEKKSNATPVPRIHIGRSDKEGNFSVMPSLPWEPSDEPSLQFRKLIAEIRKLTKERESVDLSKVCDNYFTTLWSLALSVPIPYVEEHPFDLTNKDVSVFKIENMRRGRASELPLRDDETPRVSLCLTSPNGATAGRFEVFVDGVKLFRPIIYKGLPLTHRSIKKPLVFVGSCREEFGGKPRELSGGPVDFEAYLFWTPKIVPKQHQGVMLRVGNSSGALFDDSFMGYETSELNRKSQVTAEIFVKEGLDEAINLDRESFNYAHPHYQFITKWLHAAFRQFSNRHKELGKEERQSRLESAARVALRKVDSKVIEALEVRGIDSLPSVMLVNDEGDTLFSRYQEQGSLVFRRGHVVPRKFLDETSKTETPARELLERKIIGAAQLLFGMGLFDDLSFPEQENLVCDLAEIFLMEE